MIKTIGANGKPLSDREQVERLDYSAYNRVVARLIAQGRIPRERGGVMKREPWVVALSAVLFLVKLVAACGQNYASSTTLRHWHSMPVTVAFKGRAMTPGRRQAALAGFSYWVKETRGRVAFRVTQDVESADVVVRCFPWRRYCHTNTYYAGSNVVHADVILGLRARDGEFLSRGEVSTLASHEFGHVLGIGGHSPVPSDLMFWCTDDATVPTPRDLATLRCAYRW